MGDPAFLRYKIRDWDMHFEQDRSRQWKNIKWVPVPNKQGSGYRKMMAEKNGLEIFGCWIALVEVASTCNPRGDLSKYDLADLSRLTLCDIKKLEISIRYLSQVLDWIQIIETVDINVKKLQENVIENASGSSILSSSILSSSSLKSTEKQDRKTFIPPTREDVQKYFEENGYQQQSADRFFDSYSVADWHDSRGNKLKNWKQKAQMVWFKPEIKKEQSTKSINDLYGN